jgi:hypothetical protein
VGNSKTSKLIIWLIVVRRVLSLPLVNKNNKIIGAIHLLNKTRSGVVYSESDEIMGQILADHAASLLTSSLWHQRVDLRSRTFASLLDASVQIYDVIPDATLALANKPIELGDILRKLEELCRSALRCSKAR